MMTCRMTMTTAAMAAAAAAKTESYISHTAMDEQCNTTKKNAKIMITTLYTYIDCRVAVYCIVLYRFAVCSSWWCIVNIKMVIFTDWDEDFFPISLTVFINVFCFHSQLFFALVPFRMIFSLRSCRSMHALSPHLFAAIFNDFSFSRQKAFLFFPLSIPAQS